MYSTALMAVYEDEYNGLVLKCDSAMREHQIAKNRVVDYPSDAAERLLLATEIALLDCQDYDLLRKKLIRYGLTENDLATLALRFIEAESIDLRDVITVHEIK